ncbi:arsenate reductase [Flavobacteriaceae bacterium F08102]|nr:arsenate reductase [Flavobacteriaceae bacterium F08102]
MKKIYYLRTCDTCKRILSSLPLDEFELQDIKSNPITTNQLDEMVALSKSYEALFSKRAKKYTAMGLKHEQLKEADFRQLLLQEYTFLKRPVIIVDDDIFIGNSKATLKSLLEKLN